ncbi:MAG: M42 family metallopeptidase [Clostridia bacterium]
MINLKLIDTLCNISGTSGNEEKVCKFIKKEIKDYVDELKVDTMGNLIAFKKGEKTPKNRVMICAHMDEVGFIVKDITEDGMIKFGFCGGIDTKVVLGRRVKFGKVCGVVGIKAVHLTTADERKKAPASSTLYIDIGANSKKEAENLVSLGDYGTFDSLSYEFGDGFYKAKALDDRYGCALMIEMIKTELEYDTYFSFNVQEEVGLRGAMVSAYDIKPDIAVVLETTTAADISDVKGQMKVCCLGEGVVISYMDRATIYDEELYNKATALADAHGIKWQTKSLIAGGNDSGTIHKSRAGVKTVALSVPTRYLHSPACVAKISDMEETYKMLEIFMKEGIN